MQNQASYLPGPTSEDIRQRMEDVRKTLDADVQDFVESTSAITDWKLYLRRYPGLCLIAAVAVGYLLIPKRKLQIAPDAESLSELAKSHNVVIHTCPQRRALSEFVKSMLVPLAVAALRTSVRTTNGRTSSENSPPHGDGFEADTSSTTKWLDDEDQFCR